MKTIKDIIDKFDEMEGLSFGSKEDKKESYRQFLQDNLTLMLESIEKELPEKSNLKNVSEYWSGYNAYRQEVINIINSHKTL